MFNESEVVDRFDWEGMPAVVVDSSGSLSAFAIFFDALPGAWERVPVVEVLASGRKLSKADFQEVFANELAKKKI